MSSHQPQQAMTVSMALIWYFASIHFIFLLSIPKNVAHLEFNVSVHHKIRCLEKERVALLSFKHKLIDEFDILSSWNTNVNTDCCNWKGVECSNITTTHHHVIGLDLHGSKDYGRYLMGEVGSSLTQLSHLNYLDLSNNCFHRIVLEDIASLMDLKYLNLSYNTFYGVHAIPPHLGNLSKLSVLDLSSMNLSGANDWAITIHKLPMLQSLFLRRCYLPTPIILSSHHSNTNFSRFLVELDLSANFIDITSSNYYSWMINLTNLVHLNLGYNNLQGLNFNDFENMTSLVFLDLTSTQVNFRSFKSFGSLCNLNSLYLSRNNIGGLLSDFLKAFPPYVLHSVQSLYLASNNMSGFLPNFTMLPSLKELDLSDNKLKGTIPQNLGQLSKLEKLYFGQNLLEGGVSETHFAKLTYLKYLNLSGNHLKLKFKSDWVPPFQLVDICLGHCQMGPLFPKWLQTQNFSYIDISFAEISDIIPHWFWYTLSPNLRYIDLSGNNIIGEIPDLSVNYFIQIMFINLKSNKFIGRIPAVLFQPFSLYLSNNSFSDISGLCELVDSPLAVLELSNNQLLGQLPNCWHCINNLHWLDLSNNYLSGDIPNFMSNLTQLNALLLRNNQFSGGLHNLFNLTNSLNTFDAMKNNFSGRIPSWIGWKFPYLIHLNLKSNNFHGDLPSTLCNLSNIQVLDISSNYISGSIPTCINNFNVLSQTSRPRYSHEGFDELWMQRGGYLAITWKHQERLITGEVLILEKGIDLSCNHLTGNIPTEITELIGLATLNLSNNELTGHIPDNIGQLQSLESLDLSRNRLYGRIPATLSQISTLSALDLSYNNLSGKIPTGTQLQSFSNSSYEGNPYLCGDPLKKCEANINNNNVDIDNENENEDSWLVLREFFISMTFGYIVGFWGIFGSLVLHRRWRHVYFKFLRNIIH